MSQLAIVDLPSDDAPSTAEASIGALYRVIESNLEKVGGLGPAADLMRINAADLRRALDAGTKVGTKRARDAAKGASPSPAHRYLAIDHVIRFGERVSQYSVEAAQRIAVALVAPMDLLVMPRTQMTALEMEERLLAYLRRFPLGEQMIREALGPFDPRVQTTAAQRVHLLKEYMRRCPNGEQMIRDALATPSPAFEVEENRR